jgi:tetratricopeptide (TPR) repeat protein
MQGQSASPTSRAGLWWTAALILGLALACYWPALRGGMVWDDDAHVTRPELRSTAGLRLIWSEPGATQQYYPLLHSAFWVEHRLWGDSTLGYHLANVLLHAAGAFLLVLVLRRLMVPGACLAGLVFAVHPVCVESVAWISEQKNTLSLVFYLLAVLAYLGFDGRRGRPGAARLYFAASLLFVLALLTKTVTATLPAAILVILWWKRGSLSWRRDVPPLVPWFVVAAASGLFTALVERKLVGAEGAGFSLSLAHRFLLAGRVVWFYLGKLVWPTHLVFIYPHWNAAAGGAAWALCLAAAVLVTAALWLLRRRSRGPLAAWLFFVGSLFPALGFFNVYPFLFSYVADHFQYLACIGPIAAFSAGVVLLLDRAPQGVRAAGMGLISGLVAALAVLSNAQSRIYADQPALYKATIAGNPSCWMAHNNLGLWYDDHGDLERAIAHFREAIRLKDDYAEAHNNLGSVLRKIPGRLDEAMAQFGTALRLQPGYAEAHNNLGVGFEDRGQFDEAEAQYLEAIRIRRDYASAQNNLGGVLLKIPGRLDDAIAHLREALRLRPDFAEAHDNLGNAWLIVPGRMSDALAEYTQALRLKPDYAEAHNNLGNLLLKAPGRLNDSIVQFREALRLEPDNAEAHNNLGSALSAQGRIEEAVAQYKEALRLKPALVGIHFNIAMALLNVPGRRGEAADQLELFLGARPDNEAARQLLSRLRRGPP